MQLNLPELLKQQEGEQLEYKQRITSLEKIAKTICAFANTKGGILLVGIKDDHTVTGIDPEEEKFMLEQAATDWCQPPVPLNYAELEDEDQLTVLVVNIDQSSNKPHSCRNSKGLWQIYVRQQDKSVPAGKHLIRRLQQGLQCEAPAPSSLSNYEKSILQYIAIHQRITAKQLMILLNFSKRRAMRTLQEMINKGLLRVFEHEKEPFYA